MRGKRIVYIGNKLGQHNSGTVTTLDTLSTHLKNEGFDIRSASGKKNKLLRLLDMLFTLIQFRNWADYVLIDTYSTQNFQYAVTTGNLCRLFKIPYIPILHGGNLPERLVKSKSQSYKLFHGAYQNVAPSPYLLHHFENAGYKNLKYIPNTIPLKDYPYKKRSVISPKLLWVRSFSQIYNPMLALQVVEQLKIEGRDPVLCMVGPEKDGTMKRCKAYAHKHNLPVTFTGKLEKAEWISLSSEYDFFINTTNFDNTPVSVLEAMALGLPIISTNVGGIPYLIQDKKDAYLVAPNDPQVFSKTISKLLDDPAQVVRIAQNARKKAETFDWDVVKKHWTSLLTK